MARVGDVINKGVKDLYNFTVQLGASDTNTFLHTLFCINCRERLENMVGTGFTGTTRCQSAIYLAIFTCDRLVRQWLSL